MKHALARWLARASLAALALGACACAAASAPSEEAHERAIAEGLRAISFALPPEQPAPEEDRALAELGARLGRARVLGLGEATHGQHESFELKRRLTLHLVRAHGFRVLAYEASASRARAADAYLSGASEDVDAAVAALGMMIWQIEENRELLRALRAFNDARPAVRVRLIGVDVQDPAAAATRLGELLGAREPELAQAARELAPRVDPALQALFAGDPAPQAALAAEAAELCVRIEAACAAGPPEVAAETRTRALELELAASALATPGGRDRAMAQLLLAELAPGERALYWAHNQHVTRGPLRYLQSAELGAGGQLAAALGDEYYALGFAFGQGEFQALDAGADGRWGFRRYALGTPPPGALEHALLAAAGNTRLFDLRAAPRAGALAEWLDAPHGQRWFGGYRVPDDCDRATAALAQLLPTVPRGDFDGLVLLARTQASRPLQPGAQLPDSSSVARCAAAGR